MKIAGLESIWLLERQQEHIPWYRERKYKGDLTEHEKRLLDSFRLKDEAGDRHPSARFEDLPDEVQSYIASLEVEALDSRTSASAFLVIAGIALAILAVLDVFGFVDSWDWLPSVWVLGASAIACLLYANFEHARQVAEYEKRSGNEAMRIEWELKYIFDLRRSRKADK